MLHASAADGGPAPTDAKPTGAHLLPLVGGQTLVVQQVPSAPAAAIQVWIGVGGADERDGERGLAHLHEHMLFKGTARRGVGEIAATVEAVGGQINAWTSLDQTVYHVVMPAHEWLTGLDVLADAVCHSTFDPDELAREIEVVCEEIRRADDNPGRVLYRNLFEQVFAGHPYALPVLGTSSSVQSMDRDQMRAFWGRHYRAANTVISVAGPMDHEEVRVEVERAFAAQSSLPAVERPQGSPAVRPATARKISSSFSETRLALAFPAPALDHPDVPALDLLSMALGQGESSRLYRHVRRDRGLVNDIGAACWTPSRGGVFYVGLGTNAKRLGAALAAAVATLAEVVERGLDADELERVRRIVLAEATWKQETVQGLAHSAGFYAQALGDPNAEARYHAAIEAVDAAALRRVAHTWLRPERAHITLLGGKDIADGELPSEDALLAALEPLATALHPRPVVATASSGRAGPAAVVEATLSSGDRVLVLRDASVPVFALRHAVLGGQRDETAADAGWNQLAAALLTRGTARRRADDISFAIDHMAGSVGAVAGRNSLGVSISGLARHRESMLSLGLECMFEFAMPDDEFEIARRAQLEELRHQLDNPARLAYRAAAAALYGDHPYGMDGLGSVESLHALDAEGVRRRMRARLAPGNAVWAACGDVDPDWLVARLEALLPRGATPLAAPAPALAPLPPGCQHARVASAKEQAHVVLAFRGVAFGDPRRYALQVLAALLGGQGGRLFLDLRDRQSLAYSVGASSGEGIDAGTFQFYIGTAPDKVETALRGLEGHIERVCAELVGGEELDRARRSLAGSYAIGLQRSGARAGSLCFGALYGTGVDWHADIDALLAVSAEDVRAAARAVLTLGHHVEAVVGPDR